MAELDVVHSDPEILGGTPVFAGTRVPVKNLLDYLAAGDSLEKFLDHFPSVSREQRRRPRAGKRPSDLACASPSMNRVRSLMPTNTVRNVLVRIGQFLKALTNRQNRPMEQEARDCLEGCAAKRRVLLDEIEAGWSRQTRRPTAEEIDTWIAVRQR